MVILRNTNIITTIHSSLLVGAMNFNVKFCAVWQRCNVAEGLNLTDAYKLADIVLFQQTKNQELVRIHLSKSKI
jgi:hypothetical protein